MSTEVCDCLVNNKTKQNDEIMKCFKLENKQFGKKYDSLYFKISQKKYNTYVEKLNNSIFFSLQEIMVRDCESYSAQFKMFQEQFVSNIYKKFNNKNIDSLNFTNQEDEKFLIEKVGVNIALKNFDAAINDLKKIITLNKYDKWGYLLLAWIYEENGELVKSIDVYKKFLDFNPAVEVKAYLEITKLKLNTKKN